ncbi:MAG: TRAP transporter large permease subunit [Corallococcus sp.]|nr:TRAP transporter large permease subunit [Corallococcus sp.]
MLQIELLYLAVMIVTFVVLLLAAKLPSGICLMLSAVVGAILAVIFSGAPFDLRYFIEGTFGYFDTILIITTAMIFMGACQVSGALEYISALLVKAFRKFPTILLIAFMIIIMFPAMVTGSSLASAISAGALIAPIMIKWGIPKAKAGAIVAMGSILGMVAPPINVPAMVICEVVDIPFVNFGLPLLILALPLAIVTVLLLGRKFVKPLSKEDAEQVVNMGVLKELKWYVTLPFILLILLIVLEMIFPAVLGAFAMPAMFVVCTVVALVTGRKLPFFKKFASQNATEQQTPTEPTLITDTTEITVPQKQQKQAEDAPQSVVEVVYQGVNKSLSAMGLLMGVGMFMSLLTLDGSRGWFTALATMIPGVGRYISMVIALPLFGGISAFGSASILGGPYVMAFLNVNDEVLLTCGMSLLAALGEFSPPTAMSAKFASDIVGEKSWFKITKSALIGIAVCFVYGVFYTIGISAWVGSQNVGQQLIALAAGVGVAVIFAVVFSLMSQRCRFLNKYAYVVGSEPSAEEAQEQTEITQDQIAAQDGVFQDFDKPEVEEIQAENTAAQDTETQQDKQAEQSAQDTEKQHGEDK